MQARHWLPPGSLDGEAVAKALAGTLDAWATAWFGRAHVRAAGVAPGDVMTAPADGQWLDSACGLALAVPGASRDALLSMMLGPPSTLEASSVKRESANAVDADIVAKLARDCLDDLGRRLVTRCALPPETRWVYRDGARKPNIATPHGVTLSRDGMSPVLRVVLAEDLALGLRKSTLPPSPTRSPPPRPRADALARQRIAVGAAVGRCRLTLGEVAGLSVGDMLVLDTPTAEPLALAIDGAVVAPAMWTVGEARDRLHLTLLDPVPRMIR